MRYCVQFFLLIACFHLHAQVEGKNNISSGYFDPARDPLAVRADTVIQLLVSESTLAKSLGARLGEDCQVLKIFHRQMPKGGVNLVLEGVLKTKGQQRFLMSVPLLPDAQSRYYYAAAQGIICSAPGCNNCSIDQGNCVGCCSDMAQGATILPAPLSKVSTTLKK